MTERAKYPVLIRMEGTKRGGDRNAVAFFPYANANYGRIGCYAHIGQHSEAALQYYWVTKKPKAGDADAVAELLEELRGIYESEPDAVTLVVKQRLPHDWRAHAWRTI